jgi:hypothetical protein
MKIYHLLSIPLFFFLPSRVLGTMPQRPPIDLDRSQLQRLGFEVDIGVNNGTVFLLIEYPATIDNQYYPIGVDVITKVANKVISRSSTLVSDKIRSINVQYSLKDADVEVAMSYTCQTKANPFCAPGRRYGIKSVSNLIRGSDIK